MRPAALAELGVEFSMVPSLKRLLRALSRDGLDVSPIPGGWSVRLNERPDLPPARVLLPDELPLEAKALRQLAGLSSVVHPEGGCVTCALATPDFHPGDSGVAIGSVVETEGLVLPAAVGTDINCGMRLHVVDLPLERFLPQQEALVQRLTGDYLLGTRDLPMPASALRALFHEGLLGWLNALEGEDPRGLGRLAASDRGQLLQELERVFGAGSMSGDKRWAPQDLCPDQGVVRDGGLATIGGGNHFVEIQVVEQVLDRKRAWSWGVREGQLAFMIHSGSRNVGKEVGRTWKDRARDLWPSGHKHPPEGLYGLSLARDPEAVAAYLQAEATAANYGFLNRLLLAELMRLALRERFGELEAPLVYDLPHNITLPSSPGRWITRKGACPALSEQPVIIPGSMGDRSILAVGLGQEAQLCSASHGAGRLRSRFDMGHMDPRALGLEGVRVVTLRPERAVEEAPAAYKPIGPVIESQVQAGVIGVVARLRPLLTFKA